MSGVCLIRSSYCARMRSYANRMLLVSVVVLAVIAIFWACLCKPIQRFRNKHKALRTMRLLQKTTTALERAIDHLLEVGTDISLDGIFGVRLAHDQLTALLHQIILRDNLANQQLNLSPILLRLSNLREKAFKFWQTFTPAESDPLRSFLIDGNWDLWYSSRDIDHHLLPKYRFQVTFQESLSQRRSQVCMAEAYTKLCNISDNCWSVMIVPSFHGYSLTHQVLFILNGIALGCNKEIEVAVQKYKGLKMDQLLAQRCAAIYHEAEMVAANDFPFQRRDLFLEYVFLCGVLGYRDFFKEKWLFSILGWQSDKGCYAAAPGNEDGNSSPKARHRQKRDEQFLADGCLSHFTSVAIAALGQYVRFLLDPLLLA